MCKHSFLSAAGCGVWVCVSVVAARTRALHYVQGDGIRGHFSTRPLIHCTAKPKLTPSEAGLRNLPKAAVEEASSWTPLLAVAAACGLAVGMSFPSPSSAEMSYEAKAAVDIKWKEDVKQLSEFRDQEAKDAYLEWKDSTAKAMAEYTKDTDAAGEKSRVQADAIVTEKKASLEAAEALPRLPLGSSGKDLADAAAGKKANEAVAMLAAANKKVEVEIEGKRAEAIGKANAHRDDRLKAADDTRTEWLKKYEADKRAALSDM